jgi:hypothetical protein
MLNEKIIDLQTGEEVIRPYTKAEIAEVEAENAKAEEKLIEKAAKAIARQALLERLGITEEESKLLLN